MIDMKWIRNDPEKVKENIRKKFQDDKLPLVDEVVELDQKFREAKVQGDELRSQRKSISKKIGALMGQGKKEEAEAVKAEVGAIGTKLEELEKAETELSARIREIMLVIPNFIDDSVPIGKDDSENVEVERFGEPVVPDFEVPYHVDIMEKLHGIDIDAARDTSGNGFYYLCGDIARLHSSILAYARDFMINKGFTYYIPPFMIRSNVVTGVMSFAEMEGMMYKIEGEDLYLIGTSEHSMIGKFIDTILPEEKLPHYENKSFKNISSDDLNLESEEEKKSNEAQIEQNKDLLDFMKESLSDKVAKVVLSQRLKSHPVCLSTEGEITLEMEKVLNAMPSGGNVKAIRVLEINANHPIFQTLQTLFEHDKDKLKSYTNLLYGQALLMEGIPIEDPVTFSNQICDLMNP